MPCPTSYLDLESAMSARETFARFGGQQLRGLLLRGQMQVVKVERGVVAGRAIRFLREYLSIHSRQGGSQRIDRLTGPLPCQIPQRKLKRTPPLCDGLLCGIERVPL